MMKMSLAGDAAAGVGEGDAVWAGATTQQIRNTEKQTVKEYKHRFTKNRLTGSA